MRYEEVAGKENGGSREFWCNKVYLCLNVKKCQCQHSCWWSLNSIFVTAVSMEYRSAFVPGRCKRFLSFLKHSDRHWGTRSLLFNGYLKIGRGVKLNTHLRLVTRLKMMEAVLELLHMPSRRAQRPLHLLPS